MRITDKPRCAWCGSDPQYIAYHDSEWGVPCYDSRKLFEMLNLEAVMAGLSWLTILRKRDHYRQVFHHFDPNAMAQMGNIDVDSLMLDAGIVRHRGKILAFIQNAKAYLALTESGLCFSDWVWQYVANVPCNTTLATESDAPSKTAISDQMSKDLKAAGFTFVGSTTCYAFMQAAGLVNDHVVGCFRHKEVQAM